MNRHIFNYTLGELRDTFVTEFNEPCFRANQVWKWLYCSEVDSFDNMLNIPKELRSKLTEMLSCTHPRVAKEIQSSDDTIKWLIEFGSVNQCEPIINTCRNSVEVVYIPERTRGTLCISSQIGCALACKFCNTGTQGFTRNLTCADIIGQVMFASKWLHKHKENTGLPRLTNIVFMGMGEPLLNYRNVVRAIQILISKDGFAFPLNRITLSTSGIAPHIVDCANVGVPLAVSLHAANDELRSVIMPINNQYPLNDVIEACREYCKITNKKITFEYVMLRDVNDSIGSAKSLIKLLSSVPSKINIIPFNEWPGAPFKCSCEETISNFIEVLNNSGLFVFARKPRGQDIGAACGQLKSC